MNLNKTKWVPEIFYEDSSEGITKGMPFMRIPDDREIPSSLFFAAVKQNNDYDENDENSYEVDLVVQHYVSMTCLKEFLDVEIYDKVRIALGFKKLSDSIKDTNYDYLKEVE